MGNRVLVQFVNGKDFSPAIYAHWSGSRSAQVISQTRDQMTTHAGTVDYVAARCLQNFIGDDNGSLSFGIHNVDHRLTASDSHGDAGVWVVDIYQKVWVATNYDGDISEIEIPENESMAWRAEQEIKSSAELTQKQVYIALYNQQRNNTEMTGGAA